MDNFKGLAHIGVYTTDIEESKRFYTENFGFRVDYESVLEKPGNQWLKLCFLSLGGMVIELLQPSDGAKVREGNGGNLVHFAIEVENLEYIVETLKGNGIVFETDRPRKIEKLFGGVQVIFLRGPSGESIELFERLG